MASFHQLARMVVSVVRASARWSGYMLLSLHWARLDCLTQRCLINAVRNNSWVNPRPLTYQKFCFMPLLWYVARHLLGLSSSLQSLLLFTYILLWGRGNDDNSFHSADSSGDTQCRCTTRCYTCWNFASITIYASPLHAAVFLSVVPCELHKSTFSCPWWTSVRICSHECQGEDKQLARRTTSNVMSHCRQSRMQLCQCSSA
jgi:hypothetical protein